MTSTITTSSTLSVAEQEQLIAKLEVFSIQGRSRHGHSILRVIGNVFPGNSNLLHHLSTFFRDYSILVNRIQLPPQYSSCSNVLMCTCSWTAKLVKMEALKRYLEENIFPTLAKSPFSVVYIHTGVERSRNFPGLLALRSICNAIPDQVRENLDKVYFLHPGLQSRLLLSIFFPVLVGTWLARISQTQILSFTPKPILHVAIYVDSWNHAGYIRNLTSWTGCTCSGVRWGGMK